MSAQSVNLCDTDFTKVLEQISGAVLITDTHGRILYANNSFSETTGYTLDEIRGRNPSILQSKKTDPAVYQDLWSTISSGKTWSGRILNRRKPALPLRIAGGNPRENDEYWAQLTVTPVRNQDGEIYLYAALHQDISSQIEIERVLNFDRIGAQVRAQIASILQGTDPLIKKLGKALEVLASLEELDIENKCGIFVANEERTHLNMLVTHGEFSQEFLQREQQVPFGTCLCGRAIVSGETLISDDCFCDERHENTFVGMTPHGHYIIPLRVHDTVMGVMFLYTQVYPSRNPTRINLLENIGHLIAQAIQNDHIEQKLIEASDAAKASSIAKSEFLANMSHEIRTPLNGILGFTDMLLRDDERTTPQDRQEWLGVIQTSGQHLLQLINNILDLSKVESGEIELEITPCDPMGILAELASVMRIHAADKMIKLNVESVGRLPKTIRTDPTRFRQVLTNLVGNAIKFTEQGSVTMRARTCDTADGESSLIIEVIDTGMGIPDEKLETIFEPFSQADSSITRNFGGTGLGLTISRNLIETMGGSLCVSSTVGVGSTFAISMPIGKTSEVEFRDQYQSESIRATRAAESKESIQTRLDGHILLVDDGQTNRQLIGLILKRAGAKVTTANDGQEGFDLATKTPFDLILMDMQMPVMDGYTASTKLREHGITTPIIALTASAMTRDRERCLNAGCSDYLTKPVNTEELIERVEEWIKKVDGHIPEPENTEPLVSTLPMDDPDIRQIVQGYVEVLPEQLDEIEQAITDRNHQQLAGIVHKIIGSGGMVGLDAITQAAIELEACLEEQSIEAQLEEIQRAFDQLKQIAQRAQRGIQSLPPITP